MNNGFKVLVRPIYSNEEFKEEILELKGIDTINTNGKKENKTTIYYFKTPRGRLALNSNSYYMLNNKKRFFSIYPGYVDNMEYEFEEDFTKLGEEL